MSRPVTPLFCLILLLSLSIACSDGDDGGPVDPGGGSLDDVTLSASNSVSFDKIYLQGVPSSKRAPEIGARVLVGGEPVGDTLVDTDEGGHFIYAPLYPPAPNQDGSVEIQVYSGNETSEPLPLDVEALPESPGSFEAVVNTLRAHVAQRAEAMGSSFEELAATSFEAVDPTLFRLKLAQSYVDAEEGVDLASLVANEDDFLSADQRELLDRLFGYAPLHDVIQLDIDHHAAGKLSAWNPPASRARGWVDKRACIDTAPEISTAGELSQAMLRSALSAIAIDPNSTPGRTLSAVGTLLTGGSFIPGYGAAFATAGTALAAWQASREYYAGVYPNRLTGITFAYGPTSFNEDAIVAGQWNNVQLSAASEGFTADRAIANVITNALGAYVSGAVSTGIQQLDFLDDVATAGLNQGLDAYLDQQGTSILEFCGGAWSVDITGVPYSTGGVANGLFVVDIAARTVTPFEVGSDVLTVAAQPNMFGGQTVSADVAIETKAIQVLVNPVDYFVDEPGETINISATVANANRTWLTWSADHGSFEDGLGAQTNDGATRPLKTPTEVSLYPFSVNVVSASDLGLRGEEGAAVREATARVRLRQETLVIEPAYACLRHEETQAFTATGGGEAQLLWEVASGPGDVDANGLYVAPDSGMETAVIRAWLEESPQIEATVSVDIASCDCYLNVEVTGDSQWSYEGSDIAYWIIDQAGTPYYQFNTQVPEEEGREVSGNIWLGQGGIGPNPGDTGMFPAAFGYRTSEMSWQVFFEDFNVDIEALTESYMIGVFEGPLVHYDNMGEIDSTVYLRAEFRARRYEAFGPGGSWPCE